MTWISRLLSLFPAALLLAVLACLGAAVTRSLAVPLLGPVGLIYVLPPVLHRLHQRRWPVGDGVGRLVGGSYVPWWGSHMLQWWFIAVPALEAPLLAVPGLYAVWLRAWGARVGRGVHFSPGLLIADRSLLVIGDGALFGYGVRISSHVIKPTPDGTNLLCVTRTVQVGARSFVGAVCELGPGAIVDAGSTLPTGTRLLGGRYRPDAGGATA